MTNVQVLLSVFNGEAFLPDLLVSLSSQTAADVAILARDDGSTDGSARLLADSGYTELISGPNLGAKRSFFTLLEGSDPAARFFAFCDQDDVWLPNKLATAVAQLEALPDDKPALYFANYRVVDAHLRTIGDNPPLPRPASFSNSLVQNVATGATSVINRAARNLIAVQRPSRIRDIVFWHDRWVYQVVSAFGTVLYDPEPQMLYRRHSSQVVGLPRGANRWSKRLLRYSEFSLEPCLRQARALQRVYGDRMPTAPRTILRDFLNAGHDWRTRLDYLVRGDVYRQSTLETLAFRVLRTLSP